MLIPSIDLMGNRIVQLVQGERLALESQPLALYELDDAVPHQVN